MSIVYVTSSLPHGKKGASIIPEISELNRRGHDLLIAPTYPREEVLHGDAKPLLSDVVSRHLRSVDLARVAVRQFVRNATAASATLGGCCLEAAAAVLFCATWQCTWRACDWRTSRAIGTQITFVCGANPQFSLCQDEDD